MKNLFKQLRLIFIYILSISIMLIFSACSSNQKIESVVSASFYPIFLIGSEIVKDSGIEIENIASPQTGCLHDYQLTTGNIRQLTKSDVLIINGSGMEDTFIEKASENSNVKIIDSSNIFNENSNEEFEEKHEHDEHEHHHDHDENSHYWVSLEHAELQAKAIADGLSNIYNDKADIFQKNFLRFKENCHKLSEKYNFSSYDTVNVISFHEAFEYLCEENNINIIHTFEIDENDMPSAKELASVTDEGRENNVSAIICADDSGKTYARTIAEELDVPLVVLNPITYVNDETSSYFAAMDKNFSLLKEIFEND